MGNNNGRTLQGAVNIRALRRYLRDNGVFGYDSMSKNELLWHYQRIKFRTDVPAAAQAAAPTRVQTETRDEVVSASSDDDSTPRAFKQVINSDQDPDTDDEEKVLIEDSRPSSSNESDDNSDPEIPALEELTLSPTPPPPVSPRPVPPIDFSTGLNYIPPGQPDPDRFWSNSIDMVQTIPQTTQPRGYMIIDLRTDLACHYGQRSYAAIVVTVEFPASHHRPHNFQETIYLPHNKIGIQCLKNLMIIFRTRELFRENGEFELGTALTLPTTLEKWQGEAGLHAVHHLQRQFVSQRINYHDSLPPDLDPYAQLVLRNRTIHEDLQRLDQHRARAQALIVQLPECAHCKSYECLD